jgi:7,8-dihydropterin-6-yl-methyl-4-(beta-D-ribofuranosyl)aminobenzene 5'-phosphate synthase
VKLTLLFSDSRAAANGYRHGWGVSFLINKTILFDTGSRGSALLANMRTLGISPQSIRSVVISHDHWDHTDGLRRVLKENPRVRVYGLSHFSENVRALVRKNAAQWVNADTPLSITSSVYSSGAMRGRYARRVIYEQALFLKTARGMSILTGCAHPGILKVIACAREQFPRKKVYAIAGGFHLKDASSRAVARIRTHLKTYSPTKLAPLHCTGNEAEQTFADSFPRAFRSLSIGDSLVV